MKLSENKKVVEASMKQLMKMRIDVHTEKEKNCETCRNVAKQILQAAEKARGEK